MVATYPGGIPYEAERGSYTTQPYSQGQDIIFQPAQGIEISRPSSALSVALLSYKVVMTKAEFDTWEAWFNDKNTGCGGGNLRHTQNHPYTGAAGGVYKYDPQNKPQGVDIGFQRISLSVTVRKIG